MVTARGRPSGTATTTIVTPKINACSATYGWVDSALAAISYEHFFQRMVAAAEAGPRRSEHK